MDISLLVVYTLFCVVQLFKFVDSEEKCLHGLQYGIVSRTLQKEGFHRDLITTIEWTCPDNCTVLLQESIPSGMFIDLDQVNANNKELKIRSSSKLNVEAQAHQSITHVLWVYPTQQQYRSSRKNHHNVSVTLPVHLRYHKASWSGKSYERVTLGPPKILIKCHGETMKQECKTVQAGCHATGPSTCKWMDISQISTEAVSLSVPVGLLHHEPVVTMVTLIGALLGTLWTLTVIVQY